MASDPTQLSNTALSDEDPTAVSRKQEHIELAFKSQVSAAELDNRFYYEPLLSAHPEPGSLPPLQFLGKSLRTPIWVSSMTGGTALAGTINKNLAKACAEFGMGMGLGSCRQLLFSKQYLPDFDVRDLIGPDLPLYANLGIAQLEQLLESKATDKIHTLLETLRADGLIIHVNPMQEAMQPEGDRFKRPPIDTIAEILEKVGGSILVKEVGQGMGPESLQQLFNLPIDAVEFAAAGGTNFAKLELLRKTNDDLAIFSNLASVGHSAEEMLGFVGKIVQNKENSGHIKHLILSGGIRDFLDGFYLIHSAPLPAVYGQASAFLKFAQNDYETLRRFIQSQIKGLELAHAFLRVRK